MGYYKKLTPAPVNQSLKPAFLPATKGVKPFEDMAGAILKVDQLRKDGKISRDEHSYLLMQITEFYK